LGRHAPLWLYPPTCRRPRPHRCRRRVSIVVRGKAHTVAEMGREVEIPAERANAVEVTVHLGAAQGAAHANQRF
jgi:hypothetical protein